MVVTNRPRTNRRARTAPIRRGPTRVLRGGRAREVWLRAVPGVDFATDAEGQALFNYQARKTLGISGEEFLKRWDAGEYRDIEDMAEAHKVWRLVMTIPFARRTPA